MATEANYEAAIAFALDMLKASLSAGLTYHNLWHTVHEVMPGCNRLARRSGLDEESRELLMVAAAYHDVGFTEAYANHEIVGVRIAAQTLPDFNFSKRQIEGVIGMIVATRLPQSPRNLREEILADADLDVLGRADFFERNEALRMEWANYGQAMDLLPWYEGQLAFLRGHRYFTPAARMLRDEMKAENIRLLEARMQILS